MATQQLIQRHQSRVPPGFRFHPTDEELVGYYLHKKVSARRIDLDVIREIDLYKMEPWDLQEKCRIGSAEQTEWYFFSHKDKKYPTGTRTNRATTAGFWKATGRDKTIHTKYSFVGMRKTLVFYKGRAPNGQKTDWIMHEYRLEDEQACNNSVNYNNDQDGWVVCRVFKKKINLKGQRNNESSPGYDVEEPALQQDFSFHGSSHQNSNASSYLMTTAPSASQSFACKQEFTRLEHFSSSPHHQSFNDPFSRLPQLESPKVSNCCTPLPFGIGTSNGASSSNNSSIILRNGYGPGCGLGMEFEQQHKAGQEQTFMDEQMMTDWRAVDKLAAAQLSQEQQAMMKESTTMRFCAESDDYAGVLMRLSKQDMDGCGEGELWNFASSRLDDSATL